MRKLSDIQGDEVFDILANLFEPVAEIMASPEAAKLKQELRNTDIPMAKRVSSCVPSLIKNHKSNIIKILATIDGISEDEYRDTLSVGKLIGDVTSVMLDDGLLSFLEQPLSSTETPCGDALETTAE